MPSNRIGRINEEIQRELADQLRRLKDPRVSQVGMVSITRVDTTSDLRYARVYIWRSCARWSGRMKPGTTRTPAKRRNEHADGPPDRGAAADL